MNDLEVEFGDCIIVLIIELSLKRGVLFKMLLYVLDG